MKPIEKDFEKSEIVVENLHYNNQKDRKKIEIILKKEQKGFCAYTEEQITVGYEVHIEHFNPTLKGTAADSYENWFLVSAEWNLKKGTRNADKLWEKHQPILHPTDSSLSTRLVYFDGYYFYHAEDTEAKNLIDFLHLNDQYLVAYRQKYIKSLKELVDLGVDIKKHLQRNPIAIQFPSAIAAEFNIQL